MKNIATMATMIATAVHLSSGLSSVGSDNVTIPLADRTGVPNVVETVTQYVPGSDSVTSSTEPDDTATLDPSRE